VLNKCDSHYQPKKQPLTRADPARPRSGGLRLYPANLEIIELSARRPTVGRDELRPGVGVPTSAAGFAADYNRL